MSAINSQTVVVTRQLAEQTEAMFRSVDPTGRLAQDWARALQPPVQTHSKTEYKRLLTQGANALPPESGGPSERDAAIDECRDAAHDAIHHAIERMDLCAFVKGHVDEALLALKNNAAPQATANLASRPNAVASEDVTAAALPAGAAPSGAWRCPTCSATCIPHQAKPEAGADDAALLDWAETHPEEAMRLLTTWWATAGRGCRERRFEFRNIFRSGQSATEDGGKNG